MRIRAFLFLSVLLRFGFSQQQNLQISYSPLKSSGQLPPVFTQNIRSVIRQDIETLQKSGENNKDLRSKFLTSSNYQIEKIIESGNALINDEVSQYLNQIVGVILKDNAELRNKISVYAFKSPVVNAYSYDKGYIFVNLGLVAQAETEAQLAYLLCHEMSHYVKQHQVNAYVNENIIENGSGYGNKMLERCQYSKELEGEADAVGLDMLEKTLYNPKQALKLFDVLQYSHLPFELVEFRKSFFESQNYIFPSSYFLKEVSPIKDNSNFDDSQMTHPNTARRKSAIAEKIKFADMNNRQDFIIGKEKFEYVRDLARMELCRLYLKNRDYPNALYAAYILKQKYPANQYVEEIIAKSLYALSLYKNELLTYNESSYLNKGIPGSYDIESFPQQLYYFINNLPSNEFTIMSLNYVYRAHTKYPDNKMLSTCSDSLLNMMKIINWGISDFNRTMSVAAADTAKGGNISKTDLISKMQRAGAKEDSVYYKNVFSDLLSTDRYFSGKFPLTPPAIDASDAIREIKKKREPKGSDKSISKVLCVEPFYYKLVRGSKPYYKYVESDIRQEEFLANVTAYSAQQDFSFSIIDPGQTNGDASKINDYSLLNDWLSERLDGGKEYWGIFCTDEIDNLIDRYNTRYILKNGVVSEKRDGLNRTYFFAYVFDLKSGKVIYKKTEKFRGKDRRDLVNAKAYQMIYELKNHKFS